jgi:thioesterase domain-containing protein
MRQRFENGTLTIGGMKVDRNDSPAMVNRKMGVKQWQEHYPAKIVYMQSEVYAHDVKRSLHVDRWRAFAEEVDVHVTPGTHSTMFEKPNVAILAHLVCAACGKATESA